jgi:hypothetical protein
LLIHYKNSQFHTLSIKIKVIITKGKLLSYDSDESSCKVLLGYGIAIANGCFYHDTFLLPQIFQLVMSLALLLLRGGGARYCNILALSSLVNNQYETNR